VCDRREEDFVIDEKNALEEPTTFGGEIPATMDHIDWNRPTKFLYLIGLIDRGIQRELPKCLEPHGLSIPEHVTLTNLKYTPGLSNAELARRALVTPQSMNEVVARLEHRGLVVRKQDPDHGRILMAELTDEGAELIDAARPSVAALEEEILGGIPREEFVRMRAHLIGVLERLKARGL
jgi:DNA-binding MarR family transcriptional regulator